MEYPVRTMPWSGGEGLDPDLLLSREWLVTNGLGGYASGTIAGQNTRRYHGYLIAALPAPFGRVVMLNHVGALLGFRDGSRLGLGGEAADREEDQAAASRALREFRLEAGLPVWTYEFGGVVFEKRVLLVHLQNTVHVSFRIVSGGQPIRVRLRPYLDFRPQEGRHRHEPASEYTLTVCGERYEVSGGAHLPSLRLRAYARQPTFTLDGGRWREQHCRVEAERGYSPLCEYWTPGYFAAVLEPGAEFTLVASTDSWSAVEALTSAEAAAVEHERRVRLLAAAEPKARYGPAAELVLAADQFVITPAGREQDAARARAAGDEEVRSVIAGYHWFTDWGRDTMISLEGLTLRTGRYGEAAWILHTFAHYVRDGLIPNLFPEGEDQGLYHTADASLWFFQAVHRYLDRTGDRSTLTHVLPKLRDIVDHHLRGTRFGIGVDPKDGLLRQGQEGYQLTWMDAKVEDWVVTPRRGKAVEINALWYNALRLLERWVREEQGDADARPLAEHAEKAREAFNRRFWYPEGGHLYDVVDGEQGDDPSCRPNQVLAISLQNPVLDPSRWEPVLQVVRERLLTPVGLRSLSPDHPDYKAAYFGDLRARDAAYHQGTVWAWLIGPFIDAWLRVHPDDRPGARAFLAGFVPHLGEACVGSISEIFDAEAPFTPRGCVAQAWSVAEVLRCWVLTEV